MAWAQNLLGFLLFRMRVPRTFFMGFVWWLAGFQVLRCAKVCLALCFYLYLVGSKSNVSAFFWLRFRMAWALFLWFLVGSKSDVSAFFRLRFRNGLGTKPAGVLLFRMRVPSTFFMGFVWWLAGFQVLRCAKVCLAWGNLFSLLLVGSKSNISGFFRLQFRNGLGTKFAGVLLFRIRVPRTFFMGFVWWLAGFQVLRCTKVCLA